MVIPELKSMEISQITTGYYFGEADLLRNREVRMFSVRAIEDCELYLLNKKPFKHVFFRHFRSFGEEMIANAIIREARLKSRQQEAEAIFKKKGKRGKTPKLTIESSYKKKFSSDKRISDQNDQVNEFGLFGSVIEEANEEDEYTKSQLFLDYKKEPHCDRKIKKESSISFRKLEQENNSTKKEENGNNLEEEVLQRNQHRRLSNEKEAEPRSGVLSESNSVHCLEDREPIQGKLDQNDLQKEGQHRKSLGDYVRISIHSKGKTNELEGRTEDHGDLENDGKDPRETSLDSIDPSKKMKEPIGKKIKSKNLTSLASSLPSQESSLPSKKDPKSCLQDAQAENLRNLAQEPQRSHKSGFNLVKIAQKFIATKRTEKSNGLLSKSETENEGNNSKNVPIMERPSENSFYTSPFSFGTNLTPHVGMEADSSFIVGLSMEQSDRSIDLIQNLFKNKRIELQKMENQSLLKKIERQVVELNDFVASMVGALQRKAKNQKDAECQTDLIDGIPELCSLAKKTKTEPQNTHSKENPINESLERTSSGPFNAQDPFEREKLAREWNIVLPVPSLSSIPSLKIPDPSPISAPEGLKLPLAFDLSPNFLKLNENKENFDQSSRSLFGSNTIQPIPESMILDFIKTEQNSPSEKSSSSSEEARKWNNIDEIEENGNNSKKMREKNKKKPPKKASSNVQFMKKASKKLGEESLGENFSMKDGFPNRFLFPKVHGSFLLKVPPDKKHIFINRADSFTFLPEKPKDLLDPQPDAPLGLSESKGNSSPKTTEPGNLVNLSKEKGKEDSVQIEENPEGNPTQKPSIDTSSPTDQI